MTITVEAPGARRSRRDVTGKHAAKTVLKHVENGITIQMDVKIYAKNVSTKPTT
jgi:hypothetical protein